MRMCITVRELVLISPISPSVTWLEKPGRKTRWEIRWAKAASAVRGSRKKSPAVSARIPRETDAESSHRHGWKRLSPLRAVLGDLFMERRISPEVSAAMAHSRYSARNTKKLKLAERIAAASSSRKAMAAVYK